MNDSESQVRIIAETQYLQLVECNNWSYVRRNDCVRVVAVAAVTANDEIILVEQFRPPVQTTVIELPAGLAGDIEGEKDESLQRAAERELLEETGFVAKSWKHVVDLSSSAGMTNEVVTLFRAADLSRQTQGGGVDREEIIVHQIPVGKAGDWLQMQQKSGKLIDGRVYAGLYLHS